MKFSKISNTNKQNYCGLTLVVLLLLMLSLVTCDINNNNGASLVPKFESNIVKHLPGFSGSLPFKLETGYTKQLLFVRSLIMNQMRPRCLVDLTECVFVVCRYVGVGVEEEVQLFYYFVESERDPKNDPLLVWLTGGPGCSAFFGFGVERVGPLVFNYTGLNFNYTTSTWESDLPNLLLNPYSWTKIASIIFLDQPVATGFSYPTTTRSYFTDDVNSSKQVYEFLTEWFTEHPEFGNVPLYIGGSSYVGKIVPIITKEIVDGNEADESFRMNLKGYVLGNPVTDTFDIDRRGAVEYAHRVSLISDELYERTMTSCQGEKKILDSKKAYCRTYINIGYECITPLGEQHVLESKCNSSINQGCPENNYLLSNNWANNAKVRKALHIRPGTGTRWEMCSTSRKSTYSYPAMYHSSVGYHQYLSNKSITALVFSGDHDPDITYIGTQNWIKTLQVSITEAWKPWFVDHQVAGYVTKHSNGHYNLTYHHKGRITCCCREQSSRMFRNVSKMASTKLFGA